MSTAITHSDAQLRVRDAFRRCAAGVSVIATDGEHGRAGLTVSSLSSLSLDPPSLVVCVHRESRALTTLLANGVFSANVLAEDQSRVADSFAGAIPELRNDRFAAATWSTLASGAPILDGALASFDCRLAKVFEFGSHHILVGEVLDVNAGDSAPLVYSDRAYRRLAAA